MNAQQPSAPKITVLVSLFRCAAYLEPFFSFLERMEGKDRTEVLLLHNAPSEEESAVVERNLPRVPFARHIVIPEREGLYATWNRGIRMAKGEYVTNWNVDDIRFPSSFLDEARTLDENPDVDLTYGDFRFMYEYPHPVGKMQVYKEFDACREDFFREHQIGCFPMWRKSIHRKIGYFDEQFRLVGDFDFQIRAARCCRLKKTPGCLGAYLDEVPEKLSSNRIVQDVERHSLYLRYGAYDLFNWFMYPKIKKRIRVKEVLLGGEWKPLSATFPDYDAFRCRAPWRRVLSVWRQPRNFLAYVKHHLLHR